MKILIVSHEFPPIGGGGANACFFLSREFSRIGNEVTVVTAQYEELPEAEVTEDRVKIHRVKCKRANKEKSNFYEMFTFLCSAWKFADKLCIKEQYDKCLVFFGIPSGPIALHLKYKYKLPYVVRFGGGDIPGAQKRFKYVYMLLAPIIRKIWKEADSLIANSDGLRQRALGFEDRYKISIIENGVDNQFFVPGSRLQQDEVRILFVSRLIEGKGLQFIIPHLKEIQEKVYSQCQKTIQLVIVGDGPYRSALEQLVETTGTQNLVSFEGRKDKQQVREYYQAADLFILPSLSEGMPNVVLEAMASGLPVLMTPCEGSKELVTDNGFICTHDEMAEKMIVLCTDDKLRKQLGNNSLHIVKEKYQWNQIGERYLTLLEDR